jgi:hypothetical protein
MVYWRGQNKDNGRAETEPMLAGSSAKTHERQGISMNTGADHGHLARARAKFEPVAQALNRLAKDIEKEHGQAAVLEQRSAMELTAQNTSTVRYALRHPDETRLSLVFIVTGEDADLLLLREQEHPGPQERQSNPGQVDQRVYRLEQIDEIKEAVQAKIVAHLRSRASTQ